MGAAVAELDGVTVTFGQRVVLADVDLAIQPGELLTVVGPSGAGKSTLLRVLAGLQEVDRGRVHRPEHRDGSTRVVFQAPHLLPWRTVAANVRLGLEYRANDLVASTPFDAVVDLVEHGGPSLRWAIYFWFLEKIFEALR